MSEPDPAQPEPDAEEPPSSERNQGPNLILLYSLIALALATAIGLALMIVMPFYHRR
jgi:hypothetical protein